MTTNYSEGDDATLELYRKTVRYKVKETLVSDLSFKEEGC